MLKLSAELKKLNYCNPVHLAAVGFGSGLLPKAPGTFGTLAAVPFYLLLQGTSLPVYLLVLLVAALVGIYICDSASKAMGVHDHGAIVWDEFVGFGITMIAAPAGWGWLVIGFLLFRLFDVLKPWPIGWLDQRIHGGLGIMLDDILAGVFGLICLQVLACIV